MDLTLLELSVLCKTEVLDIPPDTQRAQHTARHTLNLAFGNQCDSHFLPAWLLIPPCCYPARWFSKLGDCWAPPLSFWFSCLRWGSQSLVYLPGLRGKHPAPHFENRHLDCQRLWCILSFVDQILILSFKFCYFIHHGFFFFFCHEFWAFKTLHRLVFILVTEFGGALKFFTQGKSLPSLNLVPALAGNHIISKVKAALKTSKISSYLIMFSPHTSSQNNYSLLDKTV